jgi:predicted PurR-regulated permease PerM
MALSEKQINYLKKIFLLITTILIFAFLILQLAEIFAMLIISLLIAMILNPIVDFIEKKGFPRLTAVLSVFFLSGLLIFSSISFLAPKIVHQFNTLATVITPDNIKVLFSEIEKSLKSFFPSINSALVTEKITSFIQNLFIGWVNNLSEILYSIVSIIAILVIVPFMTFFLLKDNSQIVRGLVNIMPNKYFEVSYWVIKKMSIELNRFVRGWVLDAFLVGLMSGVGLSLLGVQNAVSIGFVAGVGHLIPYFGPVIGGLPAIIISLIQFGNFSMLPSIILLFLIVYTLDNGFIQPNVFSKSTDMHPLIIILLILIGSNTLGILGMLFAVPSATVLKTAAREIYLGYKNYKIIRT